MKHLLLLATVTLCSINLAYGGENRTYQCAREGDVRTVAVQYSGTGAAQRCGVLYKKAAASAEAPKELWHYQSHLATCEVKAQEFLKELEGFGLSCAPAK